MSSDDKKYYVYVYIDPRNFEEFYYGKGTGDRKNAHLSDNKDSEKVKRIAAIRTARLSPIIKVIAKDLTEHDALLIEKTLIWKLGKTLDNISSGHFADHFRPHNTMHQELAHFDFKNGLYYVNVGDDPKTHARSWEDCKKHGFLAAGQGPGFSDPIRKLEVGDIVVAYLKRYRSNGKVNGGFVGIGRVTNKAIRAKDFKIKDKLLSTYNDLESTGLFNNCQNEANSDYMVKVEWISSVNREDAKFKSKAGLFTTAIVLASLQNQPITKKYLEEEFKIVFTKEMLFEK